jgi:hypothetical protein
MNGNSSANSFSTRIKSVGLQRGFLFGAIIIFALLAFEMFNFSTTEFALQDLLGDLSFAGIAWATILALAFCGIDFAGIARLFTPEQGTDEPKEVWYLFGAWLLAATMNAMLTWWGVSIALLNRQSAGTAVIDSQLLLKVVPVFVAVMVWLIRVLIIGTFSVAGDRLFSMGDQTGRSASRNARPSRPAVIPAPQPAPRAVMPAPNPSPTFRPAPKTSTQPDAAYSSRPEPTYVPMQSAAQAPSAQRNTGGASFAATESGYKPLPRK